MQLFLKVPQRDKLTERQEIILHENTRSTD